MNNIENFNVLVTGIIEDKYKWIGSIEPNQIRIGKTYTSSECLSFSAILAKFNKTYGKERGIFVLAHYNTDKQTVAIHGIKREEYEEHKKHYAYIRYWQRAIPEDYR